MNRFAVDFIQLALPLWLTTILQASVVLLLVLITLQMFKRQHVLSYVLCLTGLAGCMIVPVIAWLRPATQGAMAIVWTIPLEEAVTSPEPETDVTPRLPLVTSPELSFQDVLTVEADPAAEVGTQHRSNVVESDSSVPAKAVASTSQPSPQDPAAHSVPEIERTAPSTPKQIEASSLTTNKVCIYLICVWLAGVVVLLCRWLVKAVRLRGQVKNLPAVETAHVLEVAIEVAAATGLNRTPVIVSSPDVPVPFVFGLFRPRVAISNSLTDETATEQLRPVLAHEFCHVRRHDLLVVCFTRFMQITYWINPLVHLVARSLSRQMEQVCDNHALTITSVTSYCRTLLQLSEQSRASAITVPLGMLRGHWPLQDRVEELLRSDRRRETRLSKRSLAVVIAVCLLEGFVSTRLTITSALAAPTQPPVPVSAASEDADALLKQLVAESADWTSGSGKSLQSLKYTYETNGDERVVELVKGKTKASLNTWHATTLSGGIQSIARSPDSYQATLKETPDHRVLTVRRKDGSSIGVAFGNGFGGRWRGYFSHSTERIVLHVDRKTNRLVKETLSLTTVRYDNWIETQDNRAVPGSIRIRRKDIAWEMNFDWVGNSAWLLQSARNGDAVVARTSKISVNDKAVIAHVTEAEKAHNIALAPVMEMLERNQAWLSPQLRDAESLSYTFHALRENVKEKCHLLNDQQAIVQVVEDPDSKSRPLGSRMIALKGGGYARGTASDPFLQINKVTTSKRMTIPFGKHLSRSASMGCQLDLPMFHLHQAAKNLQVSRSVGEWQGVPCDVVQLKGRGQGYLGFGTMLAFTSWSYVHHIAPVVSTLHIDQQRQVPHHETILGSRDRVFEIDYEDWKQLPDGQWVPLKIGIESKDYFRCDYEFQVVGKSHWMLKELTSWFAESSGSKSRATISDVVLNKPSPLWSEALIQLEATQSVFDGAKATAPTQLQIQSRPLQFGRKIDVGSLQVLLTLKSGQELELRVNSAVKPPANLSIAVHDQKNAVISGGQLTFKRTGDIWEAVLPLVARRVVDAASVSIQSPSTADAAALAAYPVEANTASVLNVPDNESGDTRITEVLIARNDNGDATARLKLVSKRGPMKFPASAVVALFNDQNQLLAAGHAVQSLLVNGAPTVAEVAIPLGPLPDAPKLFAALSVRNGAPTRQPMGSSWGTFFINRDIEVPEETLMASDDAVFQRIVLDRLNAKLKSKVVDREFFKGLRDRQWSVNNHQTRKDIIGPQAEALARIVTTSTAPEIQRDAAILLGHSGHKESVPVLLPLLESSDAATADGAAVALGMLGNGQGLTRLNNILSRPAPDWKTQTAARRVYSTDETNVLIALIELNNQASINLVGETMLTDLRQVQITTSEADSRPVIEGRMDRVNRMIHGSVLLKAPIVPWLRQVVEYTVRNPGIKRSLSESELVDALLQHEDETKELIASQIRRLQLPYVYQLKEHRNAWYLPAMKDMLLHPDSDSWMLRKGVGYLWNLGTPEALELLQHLHETWQDKNEAARMEVCQALIYRGDNRGLQDAFDLLTATFDPQPVAADAKGARAQLKALNNRRELATDVLDRADESDISELIKANLDGNDPRASRAVLILLKSVSEVPDDVRSAVTRWSSQPGELGAEATRCLGTN